MSAKRGSRRRGTLFGGGFPGKKKTSKVARRYLSNSCALICVPPQLRSVSPMTNEARKRLGGPSACSRFAPSLWGAQGRARASRLHSQRRDPMPGHGFRLHPVVADRSIQICGVPLLCRRSLGVVILQNCYRGKVVVSTVSQHHKEVHSALSVAARSQLAQLCNGVWKEKRVNMVVVLSWAQIGGCLAVLQWWFFNVVTIIMNKWIYQEYHFNFPLTLSTVHFIVSSLGAHVALKLLELKPIVEVSPQDRWRRIIPMSFVFCTNIVMGNVSLRWIPVSFFQTIKSFTPATTVVLQWLVWGRHFDVRIWLSLLPIVGGILLTSVTEQTFQWYGFLAAFFGCLVTSTKTILAESLLHGYKFDSLNTVYYMAPYATLILFLPATVLEGEGVVTWLSQDAPQITIPLFVIVLSGVLAFCLNFSIFYVIQVTTAVTFNVAGNMKVAVAILVSWLIFRNPMSALNVLGCAITLAGCTFYGYVRQRLSKAAEADVAKEEQPQPHLNRPHA